MPLVSVPTPTPVGNMIQVHLVAYFTLCVSIVGFFVIVNLCRIIFPHAVGTGDFCAGMVDLCLLLQIFDFLRSNHHGWLMQEVSGT